MWRIVLFLYIRAHCTVSSLSSPVDVVFSSVNLRNVLQWRPGSDTPANAHFTVQYAIYGDRVDGSAGKKVLWRRAWQCTDMARSWCDLTNETWDLEQGYYARVRAVGRRASSKWEMTQRFDPKIDTSFGPPLVSVAIEESSTIITLKGPMRYQPDNHSAEVSMGTLYPQMTYNLSVLNTRRNQTRHFPVASSRYEYRLMDYDTEYCFSARTRFLAMPVRCRPSEWHCITTPPDPLIGQLQRVVVGIVVPSACICVLMVVVYLLCHYLTGKGQQSPHILELSSFHPPPLVFPPENLNAIFITVIKNQPQPLASSSTSDPARHQQQLRIPLPCPSYAPHRPRAPSEPEEPWDNLSVDYGFVGAAPAVHAERDEEDRDRRNDGREDGNSWDGRKDEVRDSYEGKQWKVEDDSSQANSYQRQRAKVTHAGTQTHTRTHQQTGARAEISTLVQAEARSQVDPVSPSSPVMDEATEEEVQEKRLGGRDGKMKGRVEGRKKAEEMPLLAAYTAQHSEDQSDCIPDDYGVLCLGTAQEIQEEEEEEEEGGTIYVDLDPRTRRLVLSEVMVVDREGGLDGLTPGQNGMGAEEEEEEMKSKLRLENVFVRQSSEEEAELLRGMERGVGTGWEVDDVLEKWSLVFPMEQ